jgi:hypothetical protein
MDRFNSKSSQRKPRKKSKLNEKKRKFLDSADPFVVKYGVKINLQRIQI